VSYTIIIVVLNFSIINFDVIYYYIEEFELGEVKWIDGEKGVSSYCYYLFNLF
jgi:hypothetical protein